MKVLERVEGIEPSSSAWKAVALPLSYTRARSSLHTKDADLIVITENHCQFKFITTVDVSWLDTSWVLELTSSDRTHSGLRLCSDVLAG